MIFWDLYDWGTKRWRKFVSSAWHGGHLFTVRQMQRIFAFPVIQKFIQLMLFQIGIPEHWCVKHADTMQLMFDVLIMGRLCVVIVTAVCSLHEDSTQHQKHVISSYIGCPSAKDFALLWGFELNELENSILQDRHVSTSCEYVDIGVGNSNFPRQSKSSPPTRCPSVASQLSSMTLLGAESEVGPTNRHAEVFNERKQQENTSIILQQILDLERLQLAEGDKNSSLIRGKQQSGISSSIYDTSWTVDSNLDRSLQHPLDLGNDLHQELQGEPFWRCKGPAQSFQLWSQNMQDLGICEELTCVDDFNMPDVDLTFRNFDELFGCDHDLTKALLDDKDTTGSSMDMDISLNGLDHSYAKEIEDSSVVSSFDTQSANLDKDIGPSEQASQRFRSKDCSHPIRPSCSTPGNSPDTWNPELEVEQNATFKYKDKKKVRQ